MLSLYLFEHQDDRAEFLEALLTKKLDNEAWGLPRNRIHQHEGMTFAYGQSLHSGKLVATGSVGDLQGAHILLVATDYLENRVYLYEGVTWR